MHLRSNVTSLLLVQDNLEAAEAAAEAVGNKHGDSKPPAAQGSTPAIDEVHCCNMVVYIGPALRLLLASPNALHSLQSGSVQQDAPSAGRTNQKGDH